MVLTESHCYLTHCVDPPVIVSLKMTPHLKQVVTHEPMMISVCKSACSDVPGVSVSLVMYPCLVLANVYTESPLSPPLGAALSHRTPSPWPPLLHPHTDTSRDRLINTSSLSLSFIIHYNSILQHEHEQEAHLIKLFLPTHIHTSTNTSVSRIFVKFTLTLPAHIYPAGPLL